jgi:hypothetical protein
MTDKFNYKDNKRRMDAGDTNFRPCPDGAQVGDLDKYLHNPRLRDDKFLSDLRCFNRGVREFADKLAQRLSGFYDKIDESITSNYPFYPLPWKGQEGLMFENEDKGTKYLLTLPPELKYYFAIREVATRVALRCHMGYMQSCEVEMLNAACKAFEPSIEVIHSSMSSASKYSEKNKSRYEAIESIRNILVPLIDQIKPTDVTTLRKSIPFETLKNMMKNYFRLQRDYCSRMLLVKRDVPEELEEAHNLNRDYMVCELAEYYHITHLIDGDEADIVMLPLSGSFDSLCTDWKEEFPSESIRQNITFDFSRDLLMMLDEPFSNGIYPCWTDLVFSSEETDRLLQDSIKLWKLASAEEWFDYSFLSQPLIKAVETELLEQIFKPLFECPQVQNSIDSDLLHKNLTRMEEEFLDVAKKWPKWKPNLNAMFRFLKLMSKYQDKYLKAGRTSSKDPQQFHIDWREEQESKGLNLINEFYAFHVAVPMLFRNSLKTGITEIADLRNKEQLHGGRGLTERNKAVLLRSQLIALIRYLGRTRLASADSTRRIMVRDNDFEREHVKTRKRVKRWAEHWGEQLGKEVQGKPLGQ